MNIINPDTFTVASVNIPEDATQEQWQDIHRSIITCKRASSAWLKQSRAFAVERWGVDYLAEQEVQMELALGLPQPDEKPDLNPADKTSAIVTIEGINQKFVLWSRKMSDEIKTWEADRLQRALDLLEPMEAQAKTVRELLAAKNSQAASE